MPKDHPNPKMPKIVIAGIATPLVAGAGLYASCRKSTLLYERLLMQIPQLSWQTTKPQLNTACTKLLGQGQWRHIITFSLPNALWIFSLCLFIEFNLKTVFGKNNNHRYLIYASLVLLPDIAQRFGLLPGTFDMADLVLAALSAILAIAFSNRATAKRTI